nr:cell wall metabolism sensor histidine kinase WalK [Clostridium arbusti]
MRKKLIIYTLSTIFFMLILVTIIFISVVNYQYEQNIKSNLKNNNRSIIKMLDISNLNNILNREYINSDISVTVIDKSNKVIFNSDKDFKESLVNSNYFEIEEAKKIMNHMP